jgi:hypothetical protein
MARHEKGGKQLSRSENRHLRALELRTLEGSIGNDEEVGSVSHTYGQASGAIRIGNGGTMSSVGNKPGGPNKARPVGARKRLAQEISDILSDWKGRALGDPSGESERTESTCRPGATADSGQDSVEPVDEWLDEEQFLATEADEDAPWDYDDTVQAGDRYPVEAPRSNPRRDPNTTASDMRREPSGSAFDRPCEPERKPAERNPTQTDRGAPTAGDRSASQTEETTALAKEATREHDARNGVTKPPLGSATTRSNTGNEVDRPNADGAAGSLVDEQTDTDEALPWAEYPWAEETDELFEDHVLDFDSGTDAAAGDIEDALEPWEAFEGIPNVPLESFLDDEEDEWEGGSSKRQRLSREEDVLRFAMQIARDVDWDEDGMEKLEWVLQPYRAFGRVREDLRQFIPECSVSPEELELCARVRTVWADRGYRRGWVFRRDGGGFRAVDWKNNLDWWTALDLLRTLRTDDEDEIRLFLECAFEDWVRLTARCSDSDLMLMDARTPERGAMMNFHAYIQLVLDRMKRHSSSGRDRMPPHLEHQLFPREEGIRNCLTDYMDPMEELFGDD